MKRRLLIAAAVSAVIVVAVIWFQVPSLPSPPPSLAAGGNPGPGAIGSAPLEEPAIFAGLWVIGFELNSFTPCGGAVPWWVYGDDNAALAARFRAAANQEPATPDGRMTLFLRARGARSAAGHYGHLSGYSREFKVLEVLELRAPLSDDCGEK